MGIHQAKRLPRVARRACAYLTLFVVAAAFFVCTNEPLQPLGDSSRYQLDITGLEARFDTTTSNVVLTWQKPSGVVGFYRVYRSASTGEGGNVDTASLVSTEGRRLVDKSSTQFVDTLGLANGTYFYRMRAAAIEGNDTILGRPSDIVSCVVGFLSSFSINRGAAETVVDKCKLMVVNAGGVTDSIRFTQSERTWLVRKDILGNVTSRVAVDIRDPVNPPSNDEIARLVAEGWLSESNGKLSTGVIVEPKANFDTYDPANPVRSFRLDPAKDTIEFDWWLKKGNGVKVVYAERIRMAADGAVLARDTARDDISIAAYRVRIRLRNPSNTADARMKEIASAPKNFCLYDTRIQFSVSTFADSTISEEFSYWIVTTENQKELSIATMKKNLAGSGWLETQPLRGRLTGLGPAHSDDHIYEYLIDSLGEDGSWNPNLSSLRFTSRYPQSDLAFLLSDSTSAGTSMVPGSFWGSFPRYWDIASRRLIKAQSVIDSGGPGNFRVFTKLSRAQNRANGRKRFAIVALFKGRFFDDVRPVITLTGDDTTFFDFYAPSILLVGSTNPVFLNNGSTITSKFDVMIQNVVDNGNANVAEAKLVIAEKPDDLKWEYWSWKTDSIVPITQEQFLSLPHMSLSYIRAEKESAWGGGITWSGIDPSEWQSGEYLMGVITKDEFGNEDFAPIDFEDQTKSTNPWMVKVISGR